MPESQRIDPSAGTRMGRVRECPHSRPTHDGPHRRDTDPVEQKVARGKRVTFEPSRQLGLDLLRQGNRSTPEGDDYAVEAKTDVLPL